jgi:putative phosphoribosyl transferase
MVTLGGDTAIPLSVNGVLLEADLAAPARARGVVLFAHGSGSSRHSPRNRMVARRLRDGGFATVLTDLLTPDEERREGTRFDIGRLADRVVGVIDWLRGQQATAALPLGLFGASTGAAAALVAAAARPAAVGAVVSRGGRPDLAGEALGQVTAPTLLIVGSRDSQVLDLNRRAAETLRAEHSLRIVDGATHLFEEPGALERVADWAAEWFDLHLNGGPDD